MNEYVTVRVPATTANLGPGFDCIGMALDVWNELTVRVGTSEISIAGEGRSTLPKNAGNLVFQSIKLVFEKSGETLPKIGVQCQNDIPLGRGLGSSSAAAVGGLVAGNELCGRPFSDHELLELAASIEGHPDNAAPALLGGCQIVVQYKDRLVTSRVEVQKPIRSVLFIPDIPMPTKEARNVLDTHVCHEDAVYNVGRVALLVNALSTGDLNHLEIATQDRLHQPARQAIFPAMKNIFRAALGAGAKGVFLSGAGSTVLALCSEREFTVGYEMADAASKSGIDGTVKVTQPTTCGAHVVGA